MTGAASLPEAERGLKPSAAGGAEADAVDAAAADAVALSEGLLDRCSATPAAFGDTSACLTPGREGLVWPEGDGGRDEARVVVCVVCVVCASGGASTRCAADCIPRGDVSLALGFDMRCEEELERPL